MHFICLKNPIIFHKDPLCDECIYGVIGGIIGPFFGTSQQLKPSLFISAQV
jgi:hypothetical protein